MSTITENTASPAIVHADQAQVLNAFGVEIAFLLTAESTGGAMTAGFSTVPPGAGPPPHVHADEDETFIVVEGRFAFLADGQWTEAGPGAVVHLPRGSVHTFRNVGDVPGKKWVITTPGGFERFYAGAAELCAAPGGPDPARVVALAAQHGITFV